MNTENMISIVWSTKGRPAMTQSLLKQIYDTKTDVPFETVIVISGPEDDPGFTHPKHRVIREDKPGVVPSAECAIKNARGRWVWGLNDDITIQTENWLDIAWASRFDGVLACMDGIQNNATATKRVIPFPFFLHEWYMKNMYPTPYLRYFFDNEMFEKAVRSEEMGVKRLPVMLFHHHDWQTDDMSMILPEQRMCNDRLAAYSERRPPVIAIATYHESGPRPLVIRQMVDQLRPLSHDCVVLIYDDASPCQEQRDYLESIHGMDGRFYVRFGKQNLGPNGQHQQLFNVFTKLQTRQWILLDDDIIITQKDWLDPVLKAMEDHPHLYIKSRSSHPHPHGFFMTGTFELLRRIGGYDLRTFPFRYGEAHADFTFRAQRAGLARNFDLEIDYNSSMATRTAHLKNQQTFVRQRAAYDLILEDKDRIVVPSENSRLDWIRI